jgi:Pyridoxamine 5'-phosphate oxidase
MRWSEFADAAPELAQLGRAAFEEQHLATLATLRRDGWPRINPCEVYFVDGELMLGMMPNSRKVADLERDPRITVATPQAQQTPSHGDTTLYGKAVPVADPSLRAHFGDAQQAAIDWRPPADIPLFALDILTASYISFGDDRRLLRWTPARGLEQLRHPEA